MLHADLFSRFTTHLRNTLQNGLEFAMANGREIMHAGDVIVGLTMEKGSIGWELLQKSGITTEAAKAFFQKGVPSAKINTERIPDISTDVKRLLEKCVLIAHIHEHRYIGTEHLLAAMLDAPVPDVLTFLESQGMLIASAKEQLAQLLKSSARFPDLTFQGPSDDALEHVAESATDAHPRASRTPRTRMLDAYARHLTSPEIVSTLDPVIGREDEIQRTMEILCRRLKNNPILLGEPGTGKTAIVEGLAQKLAAGDVPDILQGKRLYAVDLALLVAGTMYRGEFEQRLKQLVEEAKQDRDVILFLDEIHTIVGAGSSSGSLDAANILKPALARGEIHCIGATTWTEYKKHIEPDAALERRYQPVEVSEPSGDETAKMLHGLRSRYEEHHGVRFEPDAIAAAVEFSDRYLADRRFPDKAIDVLDEAAASVNVKRRSSEWMERRRSLDVAIAAAREKKDEAVARSAMQEASEASRNEERLTQEKKKLEALMLHRRASDRPMVTRMHMARIVSRLARVPEDTVMQNERERLSSLEEKLAQDVLGQCEAVTLLARTVTRARLGLSDPRRPKGSFLFVGPSGVGKTEMARSLARHLFGREEHLLKLDMSEFVEGHAVSKLLGSPAGYVGFRESNRFLDAIRKHPHAVLLFDEFEKAHADVQHLLLQALEDGHLTDATGRTIPLRHTYVVLTSNVGADFVNRSSLGFGGAFTDDHDTYQRLIRAQLAERFRPELLNRLDGIVVFRPLESDALKEIIRRELYSVLERSQQAMSVAYSVGDNVLDWLLTHSGRTDEGARAARRVVEREVTSLLSSAIMENPKKRRWHIRIQKNILKVG